MDTVNILSTTLAVLGITGQIVAVRRPIIGWGLSIALQPIWYAFYITVGGYPLLALSTGYLIAAALHLRKALHPAPQACTCPTCPHTQQADNTDTLNSRPTTAVVP